MGREEGHEIVEKKEVNQDSETSHSQGRKGYHLKKKKKGYHLATVAGWVKCWQELSRMKTIKYLQCLEIKRTLVIPVGKISVEQHSQD